MGISNDVKNAIWKWESKNLINFNGYALKGGGRESVADNMRTRGYDAMRISPQITTKNGMKYRAVFGAVISPDRSRPPEGNRYHPKVTWDKVGFIKAGAQIGTSVFTRHGGLFVKDELDDKLMIKRAKR